MSIYGKFVVEFSAQDWDFSWVKTEVDQLSSATSSVLSCATSTGDAYTDVFELLSTIATRMSSAMYADQVHSNESFLVAAELYPTSVVESVPFYDGATTTASVSVVNTGVAFCAGGHSYDGVGTFLWYNHYLNRINWSSCSDNLLLVLGFDETETVTGNYTIVSAGRPRYCWFPGVATYGTDGGAGITSDSGWVPVDAHSRIVSGAGNMRITGPSRMQYKRRLRFESLKRAEVLELRHSGPIAFFDQWATSAFHWYPNRDNGVVGSIGTRGDPGPTSYHTDSDCDYWRCALAGEPRITQGNDPDWFTVTIDLNGEPA